MVVMEYLNAEYYGSKEDIKHKSFWYDCFGEFLTTIMLKVMVVLIMVTTNEETYNKSTTHMGIFVTAFVFATLEAYGPISCVMNPMVAYCLGLARRITLGRAFIYMAFEIVAAIIGAYIGLMLTPATSRNIAPLIPASSLNYYESVAVEAFFSFNLMFVIMSCHGKELYKPFPSLPNLAVSMTFGVGLWAGGTHTGGFMNPILPLASVLFSGDSRYYEIYWLGPFIGGPLGVTVYKYFAMKKPPKHVEVRPVSSGPKSAGSKSAV